MNCRKIQEYLSAYLDKQLDQKRTEEITRHLAGCAACRAELELLKGSWELLDTFTPMPVPEGFAQRVLDKARSEAAQPATTQPLVISKWLPYFASAAVLLIVVTLGILYVHNPATPPVQPNNNEATIETLTESEIADGLEALNALDESEQIDAIDNTLMSDEYNDLILDESIGNEL